MAYNPMGEVDTLNMLFDKLDALLTESQGYYESFHDLNGLYKQNKISDKEFFQKLGDYVVAYSALEFLAVKVMFEIRKVLPQHGSTQSPGLMSGVNSTSMGGPRAGTPSNPVGAPPGIVSADEAFSKPGTLPSPDPSLMPQPTTNTCPSCNVTLRPNAKFCTSCGQQLRPV